MKGKLLSVLLALVLVLTLGLVTAVPVSAADGDVVLVDFGPTPRTPSLEGTISHDGTNLYFSVTVLEQDAADDDYLAFWIDPDYLNKDLSAMVNQFDSPWNEHNKLLYLNFYGGNTSPSFHDGAGGECPWPSPAVHITPPSGVSLTYTDTVDGMSWEGTIPFSILGISAGDTFGYMFAARIKTDAKYTDGYPEMVYGYTPGYDLRDYALVTIPLPVLGVDMDIKPGSDPNSINLKSKGVVPVAILTTDEFNANAVDPDMVFFAGALPVRSTECDVDGDGDLDLLFHFNTQELEDLDEDSTEATLTGATYSGQPIQGTDTVNIVPKKKGK